MTLESPQDKLDRLFAEKKISRDEYGRLSQSLDAEQEYQAVQNLPEDDRRTPWQVWCSIGILALAGLIQIPLFISQGKQVVALAILAVTVPLIFGLYRRHRWAFIVFLFFCLSSLIGIFKAPLAVIINLIFGFILFTAYPYFFKKGK